MGSNTLIRMEMLQALLTFLAIICELTILGVVIVGFVLIVLNYNQNEVSNITAPINYFPEYG